MSLDRMVEAFSIDRIHKAGARYDPEKLKWFNQVYLRDMAGEALLPVLKKELEAAGMAEKSDDYLLKVIGLMQERVSFPKDFIEGGRFLFETPVSFDEKMARKSWKPDTSEMLLGLVSAWEKQEIWLGGNLEQAFSDYIEEKGLGKGRVLAPLRLALTGVQGGPGVFEIAELIGRQESLERIRKACQVLAPA